MAILLSLCWAPISAQTSPSAGKGEIKPPQSPAQKATPAQKAVPGPEGRIALDTSEALFSTLTAINMCGYDQELAASDPVRNQVRTEVAGIIKSSADAASAREQLCRYYHDKQQPDGSHELAQYVSLAMSLSGPSNSNGAAQFAVDGKEADLPPDSSNLLGFIPLLQRFYDSAGLHRVWLKYQPTYERQIQRLHGPVAQMIFKTDLYLKLPLSSYLGRRFVLYVDPMGAPGQINARNYGQDYFLVASPGSNGLRMDEIRHTYLHYILDPLVSKRATTLLKLEPLLLQVQTAPMDESFKRDASLLVTESLIRAIEARTLTPTSTPAPAPAVGMAKDGKPDLRAVENERNAAAQSAMEQGYVLTRYFYERLLPFERESTGLRDVISDWLFEVDLPREKKRVAELNFATQAAPELLRASNSRKPQMLDLAEERLSQRDAEGAHKIAQQVLDQQTGDPARAMFILARAATLTKDVDGAQILFERTLEIAKEPRTVAWSHIMLGRIMDLRCRRDSAVSHYRAALTSGDAATDTKAAADKGIQEAAPGCASDVAK